MNRPLLLAPILLVAGCEKSVSMNNASVAQVAAEAQGIQNLKPGQWQGTAEIVEMKINGIAGPAGKGMAGGKTTFSNCVTEEQARKPAADFFQGKDSGECRYDNFEMRGGKIAATISCAGKTMPGSMKMKLNGAHSSTAYTVESEATMAQGDAPSMLVRAKITGRHSGECTPPPANDATNGVIGEGK